MVDGNKKRLGKGLAALLGEEFNGINLEENIDAEKAEGPINLIPIECITANKNNPRKDFDNDALAELATSMKKRGVLQPIIVRGVISSDIDGTQYEIIAGERRWRAAQLAKIHEVPVIINDVDDVTALEIAIIENIQRKDLNVLEEAKGYQNLIDQYGYSQVQISEMIGKSRSHIANILRLLNLPDDVKTSLERDVISAGHARAILGGNDPSKLAKIVIEDGLSVRQTENLVNKAKLDAEGENGEEVKNENVVDLTSRSKSNDQLDQTQKDVNIAAIEKELSDQLGLEIKVGFKGKGKGNIIINYGNLDQFDHIVRLLKSSQTK